MPIQAIMRSEFTNFDIPPRGLEGKIQNQVKAKVFSRFKSDKSPDAVNRAPYLYLAHRRAQGGWTSDKTGHGVKSATCRQTRASKAQKQIRNPKCFSFSKCFRNGKLLNDNDPLAGSPTRTLLRLLLPLNAQVWKTSPTALWEWTQRGRIQISH